MNNEKVKNGQVKEVEKAKLSLEKVELELLPKLTREALRSIKDSVASIRSLTDELEAAIDKALGE